MEYFTSPDFAITLSECADLSGVIEHFKTDPRVQAYVESLRMNEIKQFDACFDALNGISHGRDATVCALLWMLNEVNPGLARGIAHPLVEISPRLFLAEMMAKYLVEDQHVSPGRGPH